MSAYSQRVLADGAVAYWRLNEASGTTITSLVAGPADGTIAGAVTLGSGGALSDRDTAMSFNPAGPADGRISVPVGSYSAIGTGPATLEAWCRRTGAAPTGTEVLIATDNPVAAVASIALRADATNVFFFTRDASVSAQAATPVGSILDGQWHHLIGVIRPGPPNDTLEVWVDGVLKQATTTPTGRNLTSVAATFIGAFGTNFEWLGLLDEVAVYKTALTPSQIAAHYALRVALPYRDAVIADGAVAYWRLDEPSGTTAYDFVGSAAGTISGGVTLNQPGALPSGNAAMTFNGSTGYISVPDQAALNVQAGSFTIEAWIYNTLVGGSQAVAIKSDAAPGTLGWSAFLHSTRKLALFWGTDSDGYPLDTVVVSPNAWHHAVWGYDATAGVAFYALDGVRRNFTATGHPGTNAKAVNIGRFGNGAYFFGGTIDEVALYPTALTPAQIAAHYALGSTSVAVVMSPLLLADLLGDEDDMPQHGFNFWFQITPSDTVDLPHRCDAILVGGAGNVAPVMADNTVPVVLTGLPSGLVLPLKVKRINATNTTATGLVGLLNR